MLDEAELRALLDRHGLDARRSLGQNFVVDPATVERIAGLAHVGPGDHVVEIGPGLGSLTLALAHTGAEVLALEKDGSLLPVLRQVLERDGASGVRVLELDATEADWSELLGPGPPGGPAWSLVANLPYNVAVPLVMGVLERAPAVTKMVVMVQKEVAERLVAGPGGRTVGLPSMQVAWYAHAELLGEVPPEVFVPRPRVTSALVGLTRRDPPSGRVRASQVMALAAIAYRQRRKMLRVTLGPVVGLEAMAAAGVDPTERPERLGIGQWARLAEVVHGAER